jgi:branched-chain amino acid transport system ATP-binding protein
VSSRVGIARTAGGSRWAATLRVAAECEALLAQFRLRRRACRPADARTAYGKRRLLEIALAVACAPSVLLLDEPAAGVPGGERQDILDTVARCPPTCRCC